MIEGAEVTLQGGNGWAHGNGEPVASTLYWGPWKELTAMRAVWLSHVTPSIPKVGLPPLDVASGLPPPTLLQEPQPCSNRAMLSLGFLAVH